MHKASITKMYLQSPVEIFPQWQHFQNSSIKLLSSCSVFTPPSLKHLGRFYRRDKQWKDKIQPPELWFIQLPSKPAATNF